MIITITIWNAFLAGMFGAFGVAAAVVFLSWVADVFGG